MHQAIKRGIREVLVLGAAAALAAFLYETGSAIVHKAAQGRTKTSLPPHPAEDLGFGADMPLVIDGVEVRGHSLTLLLITSPTCGFCEASKPFHKALLAAAAKSATPFYMAVPELKSADAYLAPFGISKPALKEWKQVRARVSGTPTLIAADSSGTIRRVWLGQLSKAREEELFAVVADPTRLAQLGPARLDTGESNLKTAELDRMLRQHKAMLLDVRGREVFEMGHAHGAVNIPIEELVVRAPFELDREKMQVVDCSYFAKKRCNLAINRLVDAGFRAAALNAGSVVR